MIVLLDKDSPWKSPVAREVVHTPGDLSVFREWQEDGRRGQSKAFDVNGVEQRVNAMNDRTAESDEKILSFDIPDAALERASNPE